MHHTPLFRTVLIVFGLVAFGAAGPQARDVAGTVRDQITQLPLSGVSVVILQTGDSTVTDGAGGYFFPGITDGIYTFMVGGDNYQPRMMLNVAVGACCHARGNVDGSAAGDVNISDITYMVAYLFQGGAAPPCLVEADVDGTGSVNISDLTYLVAFLFSGGPAAPPCA